MPDADLGDVTIHYEEAGSGPLAYVYCHGLGAGGQGFVEEFPFWRQHFPRVITWDNRGLGKSSKGAKYNLPLYAQDLAGLLDTLGVKKAVVHGVSWGGVLAQQFALDHLGKCAALIIDSSSSEVNAAASEGWYQRGERARLPNPRPLPASGRGEEGTSPQSSPTRSTGSGQASGTPFDRLRAGSGEGAQGSIGPPAQMPEVKPEHVDSYVASARTVAGLREHPLTPWLKAITCPVLVIAGGADKVAGVGGSVILARNLPNARLEIVDGAGHAVHKQNPERFRALVLAFCKEQGIMR